MFVNIKNRENSRSTHSTGKGKKTVTRSVFQILCQFTNNYDLLFIKQGGSGVVLLPRLNVYHLLRSCHDEQIFALFTVLIYYKILKFKANIYVSNRHN